MRILPLLLVAALFVGAYIIMKDVLTKFQKKQFLAALATAASAILFAGIMIAVMLSIPHQL